MRFSTKFVRRFGERVRIIRSRFPLLCKLFLANHRGWLFPDEFNLLLNGVRQHTVADKHRCFWIWHFARYITCTEGEIAEVGVYRGGTTRIIAKSCPNKKVHLFDTFTGMPDVSKEIDLHRSNDFSTTSLEFVSEFLADCSNIVFHPGIFPSTADTVKNLRFCFVHIDVDIYTSTRDCLEFFYNKMVPSGIMVFDDYEGEGCPGVKKAVDEFFKDKQEKPIITEQYQCAVIKL